MSPHRDVLLPLAEYGEPEKIEDVAAFSMPDEVTCLLPPEKITSGSMVAPVLVLLLSMVLGPISPLARNLSAAVSVSAAFIQWWRVVGGISCREALCFAEHFELPIQEKSK